MDHSARVCLNDIVKNGVAIIDVHLPLLKYVRPLHVCAFIELSCSTWTPGSNTTEVFVLMHTYTSVGGAAQFQQNLVRNVFDAV